MNSRNQSLDVLRGVAILLVMCDHFPLIPLMKAGWIGVDLFFVLSGFLISSLLFQEFKSTGEIRIGRFILRRGFKIWPAFYCYLSLALFLTRWASPSISLRGFAASSLFLMSYFPHLGPLYLGPMWSLSVEEHFYICLPLLLLLLLALSKGKANHFASLPALFAALTIACLVGRLIAPISSGIIANRASHLRVDALFCGVLLGYLYHFRPFWFQRLRSSWLLIGAAVLIAPACILLEESFFIRTIGLTMTLAGFGILVAWAVQRQPSGYLARALAWIGFYSYSIYLWHLCLAFPFVCPSSRALRWLSGSRWFWPSRSGL